MKTRKYKIYGRLLLIVVIVASIGVTASFGNTKSALTDAQMSKVYGGGNCMVCMLGNWDCEKSAKDTCLWPVACIGLERTSCDGVMSLQCESAVTTLTCSDWDEYCPGTYQWRLCTDWGFLGCVFTDWISDYCSNGIPTNFTYKDCDDLGL